jgi:hypothetical protein
MSSHTYHNFVKELNRYLLPFAREALKKRGFSEFRLIEDWPQIVGEQLAAVSCPQKISFEMNKKTDGVLHVDVLSASALEFQHLQPVIVERIATYFGYKAIGRLVLHQTNRLPHALAVKQSVPEAGLKRSIDSAILDECSDPELKAHLESLARSLSKNNR